MARKSKTVFLLVAGKGTGKDQKTYFNRAGVAFENRDGSLNVKLDLFPGLTFQIRDQEPAPPSQPSQSSAT